MKSHDKTLLSNIEVFPIQFRNIIESLYMFDKQDLETVEVLVNSLKKRYSQKNLTKETFLNKLEEIFLNETNLNHSEITITSGELHRLVGGYPGVNHRMPVCCSAMRELFNKDTDAIIYSPNSGTGASLKIRYSLPRFK